MPPQGEDYYRLESKKDIKKFLLESYIYENNFNFLYKNHIYSGILLKLEYNNEDALVIRFPDLLPDVFKVNEKYRMTFNNSRGKFYTDIKIKENLKKGKRTFLILEFPEYLYRLQRRKSIRVIPDYMHYPINVNIFFQDSEIPLKMRDLGVDGFSITLSKEGILTGLKKGDILEVEITFPGSKWSYKTKAELIHGSIILAKYRAGFKFVDPDQNLKNEIINYLVVRRLEIREKILKKEKKKDIFDHLGEWLDSFVNYHPERFKIFKLTVLCDESEIEKFEFLKEKFPRLNFCDPSKLDNLIKKRPYLIVFHITDKTKSKWYKFTKIPQFTYIPTVIVSKDDSVLHFLKHKPFYTEIVREKDLKEDLVKKIASCSNVLIPKVDLESLRKKPLYDGEEKKVAIIDDSIFGFSAKNILDDINFICDIFFDFNNEKLLEYDILLIDPTEFQYKYYMEKLIEYLKLNKKIILTFEKNYEKLDKLLSMISDTNILIKPYKYDMLINKMLLAKDDIQDKPFFKKNSLYFISNEPGFLYFIENALKNSIFKEVFIPVNITSNKNFSEREVKILLNLNSKYDMNFLKKVVSFHKKLKNKIIGVIYKPIHKKLIMNYISSGIKEILIGNTNEKFIDILKKNFIFEA